MNGKSRTQQFLEYITKQKCAQGLFHGLLIFKWPRWKISYTYKQDYDSVDKGLHTSIHTQEKQFCFKKAAEKRKPRQISGLGQEEMTYGPDWELNKLVMSDFQGSEREYEW